MTDWTPFVAQVDPSLGASLGRAIELARCVAVDELTLLQVQAREQVSRGLRRGAWLGFGVFCLVLAWFALVGFGVVSLEGRLSLEARLGLVAAAHAVLGAAALAAALARRGG
jgi:hypothetical protein